MHGELNWNQCELWLKAGIRTPSQVATLKPIAGGSASLRAPSAYGLRVSGVSHVRLIAR